MRGFEGVFGDFFCGFGGFRWFRSPKVWGFGGPKVWGCSMGSGLWGLRV